MFGWPENSCLMCDMPWKNNQVRYEGGPPCACAGGPEGAAACLCLGQVQVRAMPNGDIYVDGQGENLCHHTRQPIQRGTLAAGTVVSICKTVIPLRFGSFGAL